MRIGRIPYINCYPVYGAIDRGLIPLDGQLVDGLPTQLNARMAAGSLDVSVVSAVEYARAAGRYLLLPDLAISCDGPVRSVVLFSHRPAESLDGARVLVSRSSMTSVALLELLFEHVWHVRPELVPGDAEPADLETLAAEHHDARLVIGDAALLLHTRREGGPVPASLPSYAHAYDLGGVWRSWTGRPFVFAVWVAQRTTPVADALRAHRALSASRDWGLANLPALAEQAAARTGVPADRCREYLSGLDYRLSRPHQDGLTDFFRRLEAAGRVPGGALAFLPAA
ncbi:MAG TPA: menaquinone biosynthesis protein [Gemmatimonadaceae bacterium]|nr:menaquinone biosynthesis protein [Gemmatimonadaceae bacterium]